MEIDYRLVLFGFLSYLAGGIPSGYLIAKQVKGIDIRKHGSGNPGAANVYRQVGPAAGWATMVFDAMKGWLPVVLAQHLFPGSLAASMVCGALAIFGHLWTPFLGFKGGKGVATSAGVFAALIPLPTLLVFVGFVVATAASGHISAGSMTGALLMPIGCVLFKEDLPRTLMAAGVSALILYKHLPNLKRLLGGAEPAVHEANGPRKQNGPETRRTASGPVA